MADPTDGREARLRNWLKRALRSWRKWHQYSLAVWQAAVLDPEIERHILKSPQSYFLNQSGAFDSIDPKDRTRAEKCAMLIELMTSRLFYLASHHDLQIEEETMLDFIAELWLSQLAPAGRRKARSASLVNPNLTLERL